jgi:hypothetical protein
LKKAVVVARRADAKTKKQEKLISAAKTKSMKAVAKADELRKKLEAATKVAGGKSQLVSTCGRHSNKKTWHIDRARRATRIRQHRNLRHFRARGSRPLSHKLGLNLLR